MDVSIQARERQSIVMTKRSMLHDDSERIGLLECLMLQVHLYSSLYCIVVLLFTLCAEGRSQDGSVDTSFGMGGVVQYYITGPGTYALPIISDIAYDGASMGTHPTDRIVVTGYSLPKLNKFEMFVMRFTLTGEIDSSFTNNVTRVLEFGDTSTRGISLEILHDGSYLVGGRYGKSSGLLCRLTKQGLPDKRFNGTGFVFIPSFEVHDIHQQTDGKILVSGVNPSTPRQDIILLRFTRHGAQDPTFGSSGRVALNVGDPSVFRTSIVNQQDGKIVVVGKARTEVQYPANWYSIIARFHSDGSLDHTFRSSGVYPVANRSSAANDIAVLPNGKIVVGGSFGIGDDFCVTQFNESGEIDSSFGTAGTATIIDKTNIGGDSRIAIQRDGKILLAGRRLTITNTSMVRYTSTGQPDKQFGVDGRIDAKYDAEDAPNAILIQPDGRILIGGAMGGPPARGGPAFLARFRNPSVENEVIKSIEEAINAGDTAAFVVGPNPFRDFTHIVFREPLQSANMSLYDVQGRVMSIANMVSGSSIVIERIDNEGRRLQPGMYVVRVIDISRTLTIKVMVVD